MKKNILLIVLGLILSCSIAFAQTDIKPELPKPESARKSLVAGTNIPKKNMVDRTPIAYPQTDEADIVWERTIWRAVELSERINHPLYFPTIDSKHKSFIQTVMEGIDSGELLAYGEEFKSILTPSEVRAQFDAADKIRTEEKLDGTGDTTIYIKGSIDWSEVKELLITEEWFFDKRYSQMFVRIVGICPVRIFQRSYATSDGDEERSGEYSKKQLFWIYYPDARPYLAKSLCFATTNEATAMSYDDLFQRRKFSSRIISEGIALNNRHVDDYSRSGLEAMLESQRLEREIRNIEHDFWEY